MKTRRHAAPNLVTRTTLTAVGELVAAACELTLGAGRARAERVARFLGDAAVAGRYSRPLRFIRFVR